MSNIKNARWIKPKKDYGDVCPVYRYRFDCDKEIKSAILEITAMGVYEAHLNGDRIGDFLFPFIKIAKIFQSIKKFP